MPDIPARVRLEWKLAVDRSHLIMTNKAFLLPVVVDDTADDDDEHVPDKFRELQWTRVPAGETPPAFVERVQRLLSDEMAPAQDRTRFSGRVVTSPVPAPALDRPRRRKELWYGGLAATLVLTLGYLGIARFNAVKLWFKARLPSLPSELSVDQGSCLELCRKKSG